jgi:hypothetical protein
LRCIALHFVDWNDKIKVIEEKELQFELVQLGLRKSSNLRSSAVSESGQCVNDDGHSYLGIAGICVENVAKKLTGDCYACNYETVYVVTIDDKVLPCGKSRKFGHAVKIDEKGEENLVGGRAILENAK